MLVFGSGVLFAHTGSDCCRWWDPSLGLLQGSTCVYSRKVEHVYQLVLRTIDFLTQQKQQKDANAKKSKNGDDDIAGEEVGHEIGTLAMSRHIMIGVAELKNNTAVAADQEMRSCR